MARILLVEDDDLMRKGVNRVLERGGHEVWESAGPKTALHMLDYLTVDVVITDVYMPGMSGVELIRRLQSRDHCRRIIAMTGGGFRTSAELLAEARSAGADGTIEKPFAPDTLLSTVRNVMREHPLAALATENGKELSNAWSRARPVQARRAAPPSRTSRTCFARPEELNGFARNGNPDSATPRRSSGPPA